jgi:Xaa-Pro aminopeptidase
MHEQFIRRAVELQRRMADEGVDLLILTDPDSIYYASGYWGYLGLEFGRPTMVVVPRAGELAVITPKMEAEMARNMTWIETVEEWMDGEDGEWMRPLGRALECHQPAVLAVERHKTPSPVSEFLRRELPRAAPADATPILDEMRMIKSPEEIAVMRQAGEVAIAMATAAEAVIAEGVPEYEVALAVIAGGTRKAAELLRGEGADRLMSPTIYNLQVMQSGHDTCMVHRRSTRRRIQRGDPVYLCFCGIANFKLYKLGFDREYFVGVVTDEQARIYETALRAQAAALAVIRPGVPAEEPHAAAEACYREAGFAPGYRTGRSIGCSFLEKPELKRGERTLLQPGMTFAVDGGITVPGQFGARVGDSIVVTETGLDYLTPYPKGVRIL